MIRLSAIQFIFSLVKRTRKLPLMQRVLLVGSGIIIYGAFYVKKRPPLKKSGIPQLAGETVVPDR